MRLLTAYEMDLVAGGLYSGSTVADPGGVDPGTGGGGGGGDPPPGGGTPTPTPGGSGSLTDWQMQMATLQAFFDDMESSLYPSQQTSPGSDYDHDMGGDWVEFTGFLYDRDGVAFPSHDPGAHSQDYLWADTDPELLGYGIGGMYGTVNGMSFGARPDSVDGDNAVFQVNGFFMQGVYHPAAAPPPGMGQNEIFVSHGWWEIVPIGYAPSGYNGVTGPLDIAALPNAETTHISDTDRQNAIALLEGDAMFAAFHLNGMDIKNGILNALRNDQIMFSNKLKPGEAITDAPHGKIYVSDSFKSDPIGLALVLAHEGLHQAIYDHFGIHGTSVYEEALGKLVSAYAFSGLSQQQISAFASVDPIYYADVVKSKAASDQGFAAVMAYAHSIYGSRPDYPLPSIYNVIGGSFQ